MHDVVVVGGGIAGMAAAHRLQMMGANVVLLERQERLGGIVETSIDDGFVVEGGPDSFVTAKGPVLRLAGELGLEEEVIPSIANSQASYVWWDGGLHPLPGGLLLMVPSQLGPFLRSSLLSWQGKLRALGDLVLPRANSTGDESLGSFVRRRLGAEVLDRIAEPLVAGIHGADPETMSLRASFPRFLDMEAEHRSLILAAQRLSHPGSGVTMSHFSSFRLGMGQLAAALAAAMSKVEVRTGTDVVGFESMTSGYLVRLGDGTGITTSAIVLAVPAPVASSLLGSVSTVACDAIGSVDQVINQAVTLAYRTDQMPEIHGSGFVIPSDRGPSIRGVSYLSRKWARRVPDDEFTLLRVFFPAGRVNEDPVEKVRAELAGVLELDAEPVRTWVRTHRHGLHRYKLGHLDRIAQAERALDGSGIALAGAGFYGVGLNECIASGWAAAESILGELGRVSGAYEA